MLGAAWLDVGLLRMLGPLSPDVMYWVAAITWPLALAISEPLRSALVSAAYDTVLTTTVNDNVAQAEEEAAKAEAAQSPSET